MPIRKISTLVSSNWLKENTPNTKILDGSWFLPFEKRKPYEEFLKVRIPTAQFFDIDKICDLNNPIPHMLPTQSQFAEAVGSFGITNKDHVIVYDSKGIFSSCRVFWTFKVFGHEKVSVLSGGLPEWLANNLPTESGPVEPQEKKIYHAKYNPKLVRSLEEILENIEKKKATEKGEQVVDARSEGRFKGTAPEPRPGIPSGSIPYSLNVPFQSILDASGTRFLPPDQIAAVFNSKGVDITKPTVVSCGTGLTAAILYMGLELCGNNQTAIYDGSWTEYATKVLK